MCSEKRRREEERRGSIEGRGGQIGVASTRLEKCQPETQPGASRQLKWRLLSWKLASSVFLRAYNAERGRNSNEVPEMLPTSTGTGLGPHPPAPLWYKYSTAVCAAQSGAFRGFGRPWLKAEGLECYCTAYRGGGATTASIIHSPGESIHPRLMEAEAPEIRENRSSTE